MTEIINVNAKVLLTAGKIKLKFHLPDGLSNGSLVFSVFEGLVRRVARGFGPKHPKEGQGRHYGVEDYQQHGVEDGHVPLEVPPVHGDQVDGRYETRNPVDTQGD